MLCSLKERELFELIINAKRLLVPAIFYNQLTELNLSNLNLVEIDSFSLIHFPRLKNLDLSKNNLKTINVDWAKSTNNIVESLNFSSNQLETITFLKNFHCLRSIDVSRNELRRNERFLILYLCSTVETLIDDDRNQIENDRLALADLFDFAQTNFDRFRENLRENSSNVDRAFEQFVETNFIDLQLSSSEIYFFRNQFSFFYRSFQQSQYQSTINTQILEDLTRSLSLNEKKQIQLKSLLRAHHHQDEFLTKTPVWRSIFQENLLVTCGGMKICWTDCQTSTVTHLFQIPPIFNPRLPPECFISLCSIRIDETLQDSLDFIAAGTSYGNIYLVSSKWNLMFGKIQIPSSPIRCLSWHRDDPLTLVVGSDFTIRCVNLTSYVSRIRCFIRKSNENRNQFDFDDRKDFVRNSSISHVFHLNGDHQGKARLIITDVLCCSLKTGNNPVILVGTTSGVFVVRYREKKLEQTVIQLALPKPIWTVSEQIESISSIETETALIVMTVLGLDQICCFNLDQAIQNQRIEIFLSFSNPARSFPTKIALTNSNESSSKSFECFVGTQRASIFHHRIHWKTKSTKYSTIDCQHTYEETSFSTDLNPLTSTVLSSCVNENFLVCTTSDNLICIFQL